MKPVPYLVTIISTFLACLSFSVNAATVLPLNLQSLHQQSETVFLAETLANRVEKDASTGLIVTLTTFKVIEVFKGTVPNKHTIKQIGGQLSNEPVGFKVPGVPSFRQGEKYVVFLPKASKIGFSSPVGLSQGQFTLSKVGDVEMVSNGRDFGELMEGMPAEVIPDNVKAVMRTMPEKTSALNMQQRAKMPLNNFMQLMRSMGK